MEYFENAYNICPLPHLNCVDMIVWRSHESYYWHHRGCWFLQIKDLDLDYSCKYIYQQDKNNALMHMLSLNTKMYSLRMEESCTSRATNVRSIVFAVQMHMLSNYYTQVTHLFTISLKDVRELIPQVGKSSVPRPYSSGLSLYQLLYLWPFSAKSF